MDVTLLDLWLPILVSTVAVFIASFIVHMVMKHHKEDWKGLPNEADVLAMVRDKPIAPGRYMFPFCADFKDMQNPEVKARWEAGPHGSMAVWSAMPSFGRNLVLTLVLYLGISIFVGYLGSIAITTADGTTIFRFATTAALGAHCLGFLGDAIWFNTPRRVVINDVLDALAYALITGAIFMWLWPAA